MKILSQEEYDNMVHLINENKLTVTNLAEMFQGLLQFLKIKIEPISIDKEKLN